MGETLSLNSPASGSRVSMYSPTRSHMAWVFLVPIGNIALAISLLFPRTKGRNKYGPQPLNVLWEVSQSRPFCTCGI